MTSREDLLDRFALAVINERQAIAEALRSGMSTDTIAAVDRVDEAIREWEEQHARRIT